ncbi:MAG: MFS transporter [Methylococcales bacterium]|nr:MFS transporter [Methylococcales bacterium]
MRVPYWRLSSFYFFYFAALGAFLPYWSLYLQNAGFNALEIGELSALMMATKIIAPNLWGAIADRTGKSLKIIRLASFLAAFLFSGFLFKTGYLWFAVMTLGFSFFWNAALPQFEAVTLFHLKNQPHRYSQIRLWGSIGFIIAVIVIGELLDNYSLTLLPLITGGFLIAIWLAALITPEAKIITHHADGKSIWQIIKKPEVIAFFMTYLLLQAAHGAYYVFYSVYLKELGYSSRIIGGLWALGVVAEVILFIFMQKLLALFSLRRILLWSAFLSMTRWLIIGLEAESIYWLIGAQCLHAATFGSSHVAAIHLVHHYFGNQHQGKGQALYSSTSFGLGGMMGSFLSGYYWEVFGATIVYSVAAGCCLLAFLISYAAIGKQRSKAPHS